MCTVKQKLEAKICFRWLELGHNYKNNSFSKICIKEGQRAGHVKCSTMTELSKSQTTGTKKAEERVFEQAPVK